LEIIAESFEGFGPQGTTSIFLAFAQEIDLSDAIET
jgi:hypothetical protein